MTGGDAPFRPVVAQRHLALAIDDLNAAGGVLGKKLELAWRDDQSQTGQPATVVRRLVSSDGVWQFENRSSRSLEATPPITGK